MLVRSLLVVGMASLLGALLALSTPVHLNSVDREGNPIPCGNSLHPRYEVAREQDAMNLDQHLNRGPTFVASDYAGQCAALQSQRFSIAGPVGAAGIVITLFAVGWAVSSRRNAHRPDTPDVNEAESDHHVGPRHRADGKMPVTQYHSPPTDNSVSTPTVVSFARVHS